MQITMGYYNYRFRNYYFIQPNPNSLTFSNLSCREVTKVLEHVLWEHSFVKVELQLTDVPTEDAELFQSRVDVHNRKVEQNIAKARAEECIG